VDLWRRSWKREGRGGVGRRVTRRRRRRNVPFR